MIRFAESKYEHNKHIYLNLKLEELESSCVFCFGGFGLVFF